MCGARLGLLLAGLLEHAGTLRIRHARSTAGAEDWDVMIDPKCNIEELCQQYSCTAHGHPGGVPFMVVHGTDSDLQGLWSDPCVTSHEVDAEVSLNPDPNGPQLVQIASVDENDLIVTLNPNIPECNTDEKEEELCQRFGENHQCKMRGHPNNGGFGFVVVPKQDVSAMNSDSCVLAVEPDGVVTIPEDGPQ